MAPIQRYLQSIAFAFFLASTALVTHANAQAGGGVDHLFRFDGGAPGTNLGMALAGVGDLDGDGSPDFLIGDPYADAGGIADAGAAFVYSGGSGAVISQFVGGVSGSRFGYAVSAVGDTDGDGFADIIIGAPGALAGSSPSYGEVSIYSGATGILLQHFSAPAPYDAFGSRVAGAGDVDGDGFADIIIGAPGAEANLNPNAGSAFVYSGASGALLYQFDGAVSGALLGSSVDGAGDVNGDGFADLIVGAPGAQPDGIPAAGSALVYSGADGAVIYRYDGGTFFEQLGTAVAGLGDLNGDGFADYVFGSPGRPANGVGSAVGLATVCSGSHGSVLYRYEGEAEGNFLGFAVGAAGDVDGDGHDDFLVGAPYADPSGMDMAGTAYLYSGVNGLLLQRVDGSDGFQLMGFTLDCAGDVDGDGRADVLLGAPFVSITGAYSYEGSVYVLRYNPYLESNATAVSVAAGGQLNLEIDFPDAAAFYGYKVLMSVTGNGPMHNGVDIPLTEDFMVHNTYFGIYPFSNYTDLHGTLSANGDASASIIISAAQLDPGLIGRTFWLAAAASHNGLQPAEYSSAVVAVEVTP